MAMSRMQSNLLAAISLLAGGLLISACQQGDVGAPCNHGSTEPPSSQLVTFPALSCSDLLCVYGEDQTVPEDTVCSEDIDCNSAAGTTELVFECVNSACRLSLDYVLERSMCSKTCDSAEDCNNTSLNNRPAVDDDETACQTGFECSVLQGLGQFCCQKLCVCKDDLGTMDELIADCEPGIGQAWLGCYGDEGA